MTIGAGILCSTILVLLATAAWRATVNHKWKVIGKVLGGLVGCVAVASAAYWAWDRYADRPQIVKSLAGVSLGMSPVEVTLALGAPDDQLPQDESGASPKKLTYVYRHSYDQEYALVVIFYERAGQMRASIVCEDNGDSALLGFSRFARENEIRLKLGKPSRVSIKANGLSQMISYPQWNAAFEIEKGSVRSVCGTSTGSVTFQEEYAAQSGQKVPEWDLPGETKAAFAPATRTKASASVTYRTVMPDGKAYELAGPKGQSDAAVKAEVARQHPESNVPANVHLPRAATVNEFMDSYGPEDKPIAIAPPCNGNKRTCEPWDRMWDKFPGNLEAGAIITPNGLIYRGKRQ